MPSINTSDIIRASDSTYFVDIARVKTFKLTYLTVEAFSISVDAGLYRNQMSCLVVLKSGSVILETCIHEQAALAANKELRKNVEKLQHQLGTYFARTVIFKEPNSEPDSVDKQIAYKDLRGMNFHLQVPRELKIIRNPHSEPEGVD